MTSTMAGDTPQFLLILSCPDRIGIVADVARFLVDHNCNIAESAQFEDPLSKQFFLRTAFHPLVGVSLPALRSAFVPIAQKFAMQAQFVDMSVRMRTLVMVSRLGHCLNDLLFRHRVGILPIDLRMIVSNHPDFGKLAEQNDIPFRFMPVTADNKSQQERQLGEIVEAQNIELIVLARYMQILSDDFCTRYPGRIINIHHSLLPSFKGAQPYHRAYERGVKLIGATAHYVTADLDEGPIIEHVQRVRHNCSVDELVVIGQQIESTVLANAVRLHAQRRVLLNGLRTVVFQ
jgi:formyltetrahydrofolate deformylase